MVLDFHDYFLIYQKVINYLSLSFPPLYVSVHILLSLEREGKVLRVFSSVLQRAPVMVLFPPAAKRIIKMQRRLKSESWFLEFPRSWIVLITVGDRSHSSGRCLYHLWRPLKDSCIGAALKRRLWHYVRAATCDSIAGGNVSIIRQL